MVTRIGNLIHASTTGRLLGDVSQCGACLVLKIFLSRVPFDVVGLLCHFVTHPKVSRFHGPRSLSFDDAICNSHRGGVVAMYRCSWLWVSQFFKGKSKYNPFFAIEKEGAEFRLGCQGYNKTKDGA